MTHIFFLYFLLWGWFFFQFHYLVLNYWPSSFVIFFGFFLLGYPRCGLVKLAWASLRILFLIYFLFKYDCFAESFFWKFFFTMISCRWWRVNRVNPGSLEFFYALASSPWRWFFFLIITWRWNFGHWPFLFLTLLSIKLLWERVSKFNLD